MPRRKPTIPRRLIDLPTAQDRLGKGRTFVQGLLADGKLTRYKVGTSVRIDEDELDAYILRCRTSAA